MADLPTEILSYLFEFLNFGDRQEAALVCKQWYYASLHPGLHKNISVRLETPLCTDRPLIDLPRRKTPHLILSLVDCSVNSKKALIDICESFSEGLQTVSLKGSGVTENSFLSMLTFCSNITELNLSACNNLCMSGKLFETKEALMLGNESLRNVRYLHLNTNRYLSDALFARIVSCIPKLKGLSLASCNILFNYESISTNLSVTVLSFRNILNYLTLNASRIVMLDLSHTNITNPALGLLASVSNLKLRKFILQNCKQVSDPGVTGFVKKQPGLHDLDLSGCHLISNPCVVDLCSCTVELCSLKLNKCRLISASALQHLNSLSKLEHFEISECYQGDPKWLIKAFDMGTLGSLTSIHMTSCTVVTDKFVCCLAENYPQLQEVDFSSCLYLTDRSLHSIVKHLHQLTVLKLAWCQEITDLGLLGISVQSSENDETDSELYVSGFTQSHSNIGFFKGPSFESRTKYLTSDEIFSKADTVDFNLMSLEKLRVLDLTACKSLTDFSFVRCMKFRDLQWLSIKMCIYLTDKGLQALAVNNPGLQYLDVSHCHQITDTGLAFVAKKLSRLTSLHIANLGLITNSALGLLSMHNLRLKHIDISLCRQITMSAVQMLQSKIVTLQVVKM
ncbi:dynein regulatory complex subunit 6-like [Anneissia japonica]|uniref:dynein regulatory complex subunit 6-like n=1 Tax=Anneissia japonica TaxID=1529436 RepID=UPI00142594BD|nr:dynein regulatory complex subunit 6-like [Anneissia japonica]